MKRLFALLMLLVLFPAAASAGSIVASFFPIYLFASNLTDGIDDLTVTTLAENYAGCLHDYQLSTADMKALTRGDLFIICGAGMETYLPAVTKALPELPVVDCSEGIELLEEDASSHEAHEHEHEHGHDHNAHIWLSPANAVTMVNTMAEALKTMYPQHADALEHNRAAYTARLTALDETLTASLLNLARRDIVTFHEAFPYFAEAYGLNVVATLTIDGEETLSPRALSEMIEKVEAAGNPPLFTEEEVEARAAAAVSRETGAPCYSLSPITACHEKTLPLDFYETEMLRNRDTLLEALGE